MSGQPKPAWYRVSARALIRRGETVLFMKEDGVYNLPGGGIEHGEDPGEALRRELQEELALTGSAVTLFAQPVHVFCYHDPGRGKAKLWLVYDIQVEGPIWQQEGATLHWLSRDDVIKVRLADPLQNNVLQLFA